MKTRNNSIRFLAMVVALALLAATWAAWGARPAQAIIIVGGKTGMFTLTPGEAVRVHVVNTGGEHGIIVIGGGIFDSAGHMLAEFPERRLAPGQATTFDFHPSDPQQPMAARAELRVEGGSSRRGGVAFIPTLEVFDTGTGKTSVGQDFIIVVDT